MNIGTLTSQTVPNVSIDNNVKLLPSPKPQSPQDSVQLSSSAQQYLRATQAQPAQNTLLEQLVRAAAAGDTIALSRLSTI